MSSQNGLIYVLTLDPTKLASTTQVAVTHVQVLNQIAIKPTRTCNIGGNPNNCTFVAGSPTGRQVTGIAIGPESSAAEIVLYVTHSDPRIGDNNSAVALSIDTGRGWPRACGCSPAPAATIRSCRCEDLITGLPRSRENHGPNAIEFGPDGWMHFALGGNTNYGQPSTFFSMLPEYYLAAAVMRLNVGVACRPYAAD